VTDADNAKTVALNVGNTIEARLSSNPSTGYLWVVKKSDTKRIQQKALEQYIPGESNAPGTPGTQVFTFTAIKEGKTTVEWAYARPGGKHKESVKALKIRFKISK
jgi:inhibitor of cysteine peptidase